MSKIEHTPRQIRQNKREVCVAEARKYAKSLADIWGDDLEQIETHMESDGFPERVIEIVIEEICDQLMI